MIQFCLRSSLIAVFTLLISLTSTLSTKLKRAFFSLLIAFADTYMQKQRKSYMDSRARRNLTNINSELQDVQRIMVQNIDDVLQRGETLSGQWCLP